MKDVLNIAGFQTHRKKVLIADDSVYMRSVIKSALIKVGFEVVGESGDGESAINLARILNPDLIILENILPDMMGQEIIKILKAENPGFGVVMINSIEFQSTKMKDSTVCLNKPFTSDSLEKTLSKILETNHNPSCILQA